MPADALRQTDRARRRASTATLPRLLPLAALMAVSLGAHAQTTGEQTMSPVVVTDNAERAPDGYLATRTRVGKIEQDPHKIPQAITTVTSALMEEQQVGSLREAMRNVSGISFNAAEGGRSGDNMNLRGFYTFGDMYLDGIRDTAQYNRETFNYEQLDVLRGAGAMLFGRGQAGGVINQVSKTPLQTDRYRLTGSIGTDGYREVTADLNKRFSADIGLRVNLMNRDEGSWRENLANGDEPEVHRQGAAISLALNQDSHNRFWLNHYYLKTRDTLDYGISFDNATRRPNERFPSKAWWGTDKTFDNSDTTISTLVNEYHFAPDTMLRTQLRVADYQRSYWAKTPNLTAAPSANGVNGGNVTRSYNYETVTLQSDYSTRFKTGDMGHEFLAGMEYLKEDSYRHGLRNFGGTTNANPPMFYPYKEQLTGTPTKFTSDSYALYVQDTVEFIPNWKATVGVRRDEMDAKYSSTTSPALNYGEWSTRTALSWQPQEEAHYYVAWSDSFSPTADLYQLTVAPLPAERSQVTEIGAKWLLLGGDLALRTALYRADKDWERSTDLESTAAILTRKRRTDGVEVELAGRLSDRWEIFSGLALMDAKIREAAVNVSSTGVVTNGDARLVGERARNTPVYTFNLWTTYRLTGNWKIGGGVEAKGKRFGYQPQQAVSSAFVNGKFTPNTAPAYQRYDAMLAYEESRWAVRLNVKNVFDKLYYDSIYDNGGFTVPGTRRAAILSGELKF
jgi:catecholate siderophore receptor